MLSEVPEISTVGVACTSVAALAPDAYVPSAVAMPATLAPRTSERRDTGVEYSLDPG
jgi:hypothetical protein